MTERKSELTWVVLHGKEYVKCGDCGFCWDPKQLDECPDCKHIRDTFKYTDPKYIGAYARLYRDAVDTLDREILRGMFIAQGKPIPPELREPPPSKVITRPVFEVKEDVLP